MENQYNFNSPCFIKLPEVNEQVTRFLSYQDLSIKFQISRLKKMAKWQGEWVVQKIEELKAQQTQTLIYRDLDGDCYTLAGLANQLNTRFKWGIGHQTQIPDGRAFPWANKPKHQNRYYQDEAVQALLAVGHGAIELPTASGKTQCVRDLCKHNPVKTVVAAPFTAIAEQMLDNFEYHFGKKYVGMYGDGRKKSDKLITVAVAQSLMKVEKGSDAWDDFQGVNKFICDEAHMFASESLSYMGLNLFSQAPQRYFVSATQMRNDGSDLFLQGLTGPVVYRKTFQELVDEKFLAKPHFRIVRVEPNNQKTLNNSDPKTETRNQLYNNPNVAKAAADIVNKMVTAGKQVVVILEEFRQFDLIKNHLKIPFEFLHGGASKDAKEYVQPEYWKCDIGKTVEEFNAGKVRCVLGTSAVATGTDFIPVDCLVYMQGGTSEIKVKQAIGRGTRTDNGRKLDFFVVDFGILGSDTMERHLNTRMNIYSDLSDDIKEF